VTAREFLPKRRKTSEQEVGTVSPSSIGSARAPFSLTAMMRADAQVRLGTQFAVVLQANQTAPHAVKTVSRR